MASKQKVIYPKYLSESILLKSNIYLIRLIKASESEQNSLPWLVAKRTNYVNFSRRNIFEKFSLVTYSRRETQRNSTAASDNYSLWSISFFSAYSKNFCSHASTIVDFEMRGTDSSYLTQTILFFPSQIDLL